MSEIDDSGLNREFGLNRRDLIRRGAVVGGTLLWATPVVQSIGPKAMAQTKKSPGNCACCYCYNGTITAPAVGAGGARDECSDNGIVGFRMTSDDCQNYCQHNGGATAPKAPGGPYENSQYCSGANTCSCNNAGEPGANGCTCS